MHLDVQAAPSPHDCQADNPEIAQRLDKRGRPETSAEDVRLYNKPSGSFRRLSLPA